MIDEEKKEHREGMSWTIYPFWWSRGGVVPKSGSPNLLHHRVHHLLSIEQLRFRTRPFDDFLGFANDLECGGARSHPVVETICRHRRNWKAYQASLTLGIFHPSIAHEWYSILFAGDLEEQVRFGDTDIRGFFPGSFSPGSAYMSSHRPSKMGCKL